MTITGYITDEDNIPLNNANVIDIRSQKGTTTNKSGLFNLNLEKHTTTIRISYVGYLTFEKKIKATDIDLLINDTLFLSISLEPLIEELSQIEIIADRIPRAYDKPKILIIDYEFYSDSLILLLFEDKEYKLRMVDDYSKTLYELIIPKNPEKLFRDCFNNIHIQYKGIIYQIYINRYGFSLLKGISNEIFDDLLNPCVADAEDYLFFKDYCLHNQSIIYYSINNKSKQKKKVQEIIDVESMIAIDDYYHETWSQAGLVPHPMGDNAGAMHIASREIEVKIWFYQSILSHPIYDPLLVVNDSIFIFNHEVDSTFIYDQAGILQRTFPIDYHYRSGWKKEIFIDYYGDGIYAKFVKNGLTYLYQVNPENGQVINIFKLNKHIFPRNIKIRNGFAYYLYTDKQGAFVANVYRQKL